MARVAGRRARRNLDPTKKKAPFLFEDEAPKWPIFEWGAAPYGEITESGAKTTARAALKQVYAAIGKHPLLGVFEPDPRRSPYALVAFCGEAEVYETLGPMKFARTPSGGAWGYLRVMRIDLAEALEDSGFAYLWSQRLPG
jgi:hypothetical protein